MLKFKNHTITSEIRDTNRLRTVQYLRKDFPFGLLFQVYTRVTDTCSLHQDDFPKLSLEGKGPGGSDTKMDNSEDQMTEKNLSSRPKRWGK